MKKTVLSLFVLVLVAGTAWGATINVPANAPTIEAALAAALAGDTITIDNGVYNPVGTLSVNKALTITGASEAGVIINIPAAGGYGFIVTASDVTMENFTLVTNNANLEFPIHASGTSNLPNGFDNLTIRHATVSGTHKRTGFDIHGYNNVTLEYLTSSDAWYGNGLQLTGVVGATISNITTFNNEWGSIAIYSSKPVYMNRGSANIVIDGNTVSAGEGNIYNQDEFGLFNTNITVAGYDYLVRNAVDAPGYDFFQDTLLDAVAFATVAGPGNFTIQPIAGGPFVVEAGMLIQPAINAANPGDTVSVGAGVFREQLSITKDLTLNGAGSAQTTIEAPDPIDRMTYVITTWTGSNKTIDPVIGMLNSTVYVSGLTVDGRNTGPSNFYGIHATDCSGAVSNCVVDGITYPALPGAQAVLSIVCTQTAATGPFTVTVANNQIPTFQKGGIYVGGPNMVFTVDNNTVTANVSLSIAGNGIQLGYGATGTTSGNIVSGVGYTGSGWAGTGILLFECGDVTMNGDQVNGSQSAVNYSDWHWVYSSVVPVNLEFNNLVLTDNEWSFGVQLSGDGSDANVTMNGCTITGSTGDAVDIWGSDVDPWGGSYYTGWANGNLNVTIDGMTMDGTAIDGIWTADLSSAGSNVVDSFVVTNSSFTNTVGGAIANNFPETIVAAENFWGDVGGPVAGAKSGGSKARPHISPSADILPSSVEPLRVATGSADKAAESVTGPVDYSPWYGFPLGTVPMTVGTNDDVNDALALANAGDTVAIAATTITTSAQVVIDKDVSITGAGVGSTFVSAGHNTSGGSYSTTAALFLVDVGVTASISGIAFDGAGFVVDQAIQSRGASLAVSNCAFSNIASGTYLGRGITFLTGTGSVTDCTMSAIQRIGVHIRGSAIPPAPSPDVAVSGLVYTGKGDGDFLDYGVEFGGGGSGSVTSSTITDCRGVAVSDSSTSAGILVTDYYGAGTDALITNSTLTANTTGVVVGYDTPDMSHAVIHGCSIESNTDFGVTSTGVTVDATGNWWGTPFGPFHPTLNLFGTGNEVSDNVLFEPWTGMAGATAEPADASPISCTGSKLVTFYYVPDPSSPDLFGFDLTISSSPEVTIGTITYENIFDGTGYNYTVDNGGGVWTLSAATLASGGNVYEATLGKAALATVEFLGAAEGLATVSVDNLVLRDPNNATFAVNLPTANITVDCTAPAAVTGVTAAPGNKKVDVTWTHSGVDVDHYVVFSGVWYDSDVGFGASAYPEYDDLVNDVIPTAPVDFTTAVNSNEWVQLPDAATTNLTQSWLYHTSRGVYYYTVFAVDAAGNASPAPAALDRATNYWLGDVSPTDGLVGIPDFTALGAAFGTSMAGGGNYNNIIDVGPTDDWSRLGIPLTDSVINFEDLMIFSLNFGVVTSSKDKAPVSKSVDLAWVAYDNGDMGLRLVNGSGLKGLNVRADKPVQRVDAGQLLDDQAELTFLKNVGANLDVSVAVMGINQGFEGSGDLFIVRQGSGITIDDLHITARAIDNSELAVNLDQTSGVLTPRVFALKANYPNPFNPMTKISFSLPETQNVKLAVYSLDGRKVATLLNETRGPGLHEVVWTGRNDDGQSVASGLYFYRIDAGPYSQVRKMTLMK